MDLRKKLLITAWLLAVALSPRPVTAEPAASSLPAVPPQPASAILPVESQNSRTLRAEVVEALEGASVQTRGRGEFVKLSKGAILHAGDVIQTRQGSCRLLIDGRTKVALTPQTTLKISSESLLDLHGGNLMVKLAKLKKGSTFEVTTPTATATVRGTTLYLQTGEGFAKLYVDETHGGVEWKNAFSKNSVVVPAFSLSGAFANGQVDPPAQLTPEQKEAFFKEWQGAGGSNLSQQFGIEEIAALPNANAIINPPDLQTAVQLSDAFFDKVTEQNIAGLNGFLVPPAPPVTPLAPKEEGDPEIKPVSDEDKEVVVREINDILEEREFDVIDANSVSVADAQTGKVMTDVHGNRVRVDQVILQNTPSSVAFLSLTQRTGSSQNGVNIDGITIVGFTAQFNDTITGPLKDLPWNDYMNVVTREELTGAQVPGQYEQFIVHEHAAEGFSENSLHPTSMGVIFIEAISPDSDLNSLDAIMFGETYSTPFVTVADQGTFWVQGVEADFTAIYQGAGDFILAVNHATQPTEVEINEVPGFSLISRDGAQTTGFSTHPSLGDLGTKAGLDFFRRNTVAHPAFFEDRYGNDRMLYGIFLPIDDNGKVIDAPGFRIRGIRDLLHPNTQVPGGVYNLEAIFAYGSFANDTFQEAFRIDAIITPEIFGRHEIIGQPGVFHPGFGLKDPETGLLDRSTIFPSQLETD